LRIEITHQLRIAASQTIQSEYDEISNHLYRKHEKFASPDRVYYPKREKSPTPPSITASQTPTHSTRDTLPINISKRTKSLRPQRKKNMTKRPRPDRKSLPLIKVVSFANVDRAKHFLSPALER